MKDHPKLAIENDGFTVKCTKKTEISTIKFGEFLNSSHKFIYRVTFKMDVKYHYAGIGFIKPTFNKWVGNRWNISETTGVMVYYQGSDLQRGAKMGIRLIRSDKSYFNWYHSHDHHKSNKITLELDMIKM